MAGDQQFHALILQALPADSGLTLLKGFKLDLSGNPGFRKVFFSTRCDCGTAALLSIEVAEEKTIADINQVLPSLIAKLVGQAKSFHGMSCDIHTRMRLGPSVER